MIERHVDGTFAHTDTSFTAVYAEIKRLDQLRGADQVALSAALLAAKTAVDAALAAAEKAVAAALTAAKEAVTKAEIAQTKTNEGQNEFRGQLRDQASTFLTRAEWDLSHKSLLEKVELVNRDNRELRSRLDIGTPEQAALQARSDHDEGRKENSSEFWTRAIAVLAVLTSAGTLIVLAIHG
jgi:hypothetical protein